MSFLKNKDARTYSASAIFLVLVIGLIAFLTFIEVPSNNKDIIVTIIGMLVGGLGTAMSNLFGQADEELEKMRDEMKYLKSSYDKLESQYGTLKVEYDRLTEMLVQKIEVEVKN